MDLAFLSGETEKGIVPVAWFAAPYRCMADATNKNQAQDSVPRRYHWPWFVLAAVLAAFALAVLWLSFEIQRTRRIRDLNSTLPQQRP
jgi:hypothetical protein